MIYLLSMSSESRSGSRQNMQIKSEKMVWGEDGVVGGVRGLLPSLPPPPLPRVRYDGCEGLNSVLKQHYDLIVASNNI